MFAVPMPALFLRRLAAVAHTVGMACAVRARSAVAVGAALGVSAGLSGCAVVTVADAAVSVAATAVKVTATVVETTVDVAAAGVKAATKDDTPADPAQATK
mgnify:CR=1 FL=1